MQIRSRLTAVVALGFALGSLEHLVGLVLLAFGVEMYADYPAWRHAAFSVVDALIATLAVRRPDRLFIPLAAFFVEQVAVNGAMAWRHWTAHREIVWPVLVMLALILAATVIAAREARRVRNASSVLRSTSSV
jgi:hypothetical protein